MWSNKSKRRYASTRQWHVNDCTKCVKTWQQKKQDTNVCIQIQSVCMAEESTPHCSLKRLWFFSVSWRGEEILLSDQSKVIARPACTRPAISTLISQLKDFYNYKPHVDYLQMQLMSCLLPFPLKRSPVQPLQCLSVKSPLSEQDSWSSSAHL